MSAEENRKIVERFYAAGNRGDMDVCLNLIADDIQWTIIGSTQQHLLLDHQDPGWQICGSDRVHRH